MIDLVSGVGSFDVLLCTVVNKTIQFETHSCFVAVAVHRACKEVKRVAKLWRKSE